VQQRRVLRGAKQPRFRVFYCCVCSIH